MRILQVVHGYPPEKRGGAELVTATLAQALVRRGHEVTVFARTAAAAAEEFSVRQAAPDADGVRVVRVVNNLSHASHFRLAYDHPFLDEAFQRVLTDTRPDVVHVQHVIHLSGSVLRARGPTRLSGRSQPARFLFRLRPYPSRGQPPPAVSGTGPGESAVSPAYTGRRLRRRPAGVFGISSSSSTFRSG